MNETFPVSYILATIGSVAKLAYNHFKSPSTKKNISFGTRSFTIDLWFSVNDLTDFYDLLYGDVLLTGN